MPANIHNRIRYASVFIFLTFNLESTKQIPTVCSKWNTFFVILYPYGSRFKIWIIEDLNDEKGLILSMKGAVFYLNGKYLIHNEYYKSCHL